MALGTALALGIVTHAALRLEGAFIGCKITQHVCKKAFNWDKEDFTINEKGEIVYDFTEEEES